MVMAEQEFEVVAKLSIRQAELEDAKDLHTYCFPDQNVETVTESLTHDLEQEKSKNVIRLVADANGYAVGQIRIQRKSSEKSVGCLADLLVSLPFRVFGVSGRLIEMAEQVASEIGLVSLEIDVPEADTAIIEAYERWGFKPRPTVTLEKEIQLSTKPTKTTDKK